MDYHLHEMIEPVAYIDGEATKAYYDGDLVEEIYRSSKPSRKKAAQKPTSTMRSSVMTVTPELAKRWLAESNINNRPLSLDRVHAYSEEMLRGKWIENGASISFGESGRLLDGQTRLSAVVKSGVPIRTVVVRGLSDHAFATMDCGKRRSGSDTLSVGGVKNAGMLNAVLKLIACYDRHRTMNSRLGGITNQDILALFRESDSEFLEMVCRSSKKCARILTHYNALAAIGYKLGRSNFEKFDEFCSAVASGANLYENDPAHLLRNAAISWRKKKPATYEQVAALIATAVLAHQRGRLIRSLVCKKATATGVLFPRLD